MSFKIGDKVKVIKCNVHKHCEHIENIHTINNYYLGSFSNYVYELDNCEELFKEDELELVIENEVSELVKNEKFTKSDLQDGDIVYLRNGCKGIVVNDAVTIIVKIFKYRISEYTENLTRANRSEKYLDIVKVEKSAGYTTVFKREEILDEVEKRYLSNVIRPFRDRVSGITKILDSSKDEYISIHICNECDLDFPNFKANTLYKGMEINKFYTLEELGL